MSKWMNVIGNAWRKNWPEIHCGLTGGLPPFILRKSPGPITDAVPVFCYHVIDEPTFRADLAFLSDNGYTTLTADALLDHLQSRTPALAKSIVLSFDDGQQTLHDVAFPLLKEYGHRAVAFICPGLHRDAGDSQAAGGLCDWQQVQAMHDSGCIDFQPHTDSHRYIPGWPKPLPLAGVDGQLVDRRRPEVSNLDADLSRAKQELDRRLNKHCKHMAFPQYDGTDEAISIAGAIGYEGFWWGVLPGRPINRVGDPSDRIVRVSGEFVRRLPGDGRVCLASILKTRYGGRFRRA